MKIRKRKAALYAAWKPRFAVIVAKTLQEKADVFARNILANNALLWRLRVSQL